MHWTKEKREDKRIDFLLWLIYCILLLRSRDIGTKHFFYIAAIVKRSKDRADSIIKCRKIKENHEGEDAKCDKYFLSSPWL